MRRTLILLACILCLEVAGMAQEKPSYVKIARREARVLERQGWKSMTDVPVFRQLVGFWELDSSSDGAGDCLYISRSSRFESESLESALDSALNYARTRAIDEALALYSYISEAASESADPTCVTYATNEYMTTVCNFIRSRDKHMIGYKFTCIYASSGVSPSSVIGYQTIEERYGYELLMEEIKDFEIIPCMFWRMNKDKYEVHIDALYRIEDLLRMLE